jgi:hypothetical protein
MHTDYKKNEIPTDANNVLAGVIGYDTSGQPIIPIRKKLIIKQNAHPNCDGTAWGWIEGCTLNICWSDENTRFNREKAEKLVSQYNDR